MSALHPRAKRARNTGIPACADRRLPACRSLRALSLALLLLAQAAVVFAAEPSRPTVLILVGAGGDDQYATAFATAAHLWEKAAAAGQAQCTTLGLDPAQTNPRDAFRDSLQKETAGAGDLWLV